MTAALILLSLPTVRAADTGEAIEHVEIVTGEWSPYVSPFNTWPGTSHGDAFGLATEILRLALKPCRVEGDFHFLGWSEVLGTASRRSALAFPFRHSARRTSDFVFSEPLVSSREILFFNPDFAPRLARAEDADAVAGARLVFVEGYEYAPAWSALRDTDAPEARDERQALEMVITGEADGMIADERVGDHLLATFFPDRGRLVERNDRVAATTGLSLLFPKPLTDSRRDLLACIDERLSYLRGHDAQHRLAVAMGLDRGPGFDVVLDGPADYPVAVGTETVDREEGFLVPRGTRALVLTWDDAFVSRQDIGDRQLMYRKTQVKLLDGPLRGRVLWVPNLFLRY